MNRKNMSQLVRRISLRQLQIFEAVGRLLSYTRAAEELHLSQPTVSMQLKKLESDVSVPLTEVIGKKVSLTQAGSALYDVSYEIIESLSRFEMQVDDQKGLNTGRLSIAAVTTASYFLPRLIGQFSKEYPGINVALEVGNRSLVQ
jgi:LysR family transcriptional regulator, low CO2-responsive transcriptional regulator